MRWSLTVVLILTALTGCASYGASPESSASYTSRNAESCVRYGGIWHANLGVCEPDVLGAQ